MHYPDPIARLMDHFMKLPGIGQKTAARLTFYSMGMPEEDIVNFANALLSCKRDLEFCQVCGNITEQSPCQICQDSLRDQTTILVVEDSRDVMALERLNEYHGQYHVLQGVLSPSEGKGPDDLNLASLLARLNDLAIKEVILALNATAEGEATAMYLSRLIKPAGIKVTRLAYGLAVGSDIEYADEVTLWRAIEGRREV